MSVKPQKYFSSFLRLCSASFVNTLLPGSFPSGVGFWRGWGQHPRRSQCPQSAALQAERTGPGLFCTVVGGEMICRWILLERKQLSSLLSPCQGFIPECNLGSAADSAIYGRKRNKSQRCFHVLVRASKWFYVSAA